MFTRCYCEIFDVFLGMSWNISYFLFQPLIFFCWIFTTQGLKKSSATHTKDSCEKNVPKLPEFKECFFWNCSLCVTVNSEFIFLRTWSISYLNSWWFWVMNVMEHFHINPLLQDFKAFQTSVLNIGWQCIWLSVLPIFCHKMEVKMHILFGNQGLCQALNLFFIKTRSGSHPWATRTDQRRKEFCQQTTKEKDCEEEEEEECVGHGIWVLNWISLWLNWIQIQLKIDVMQIDEK
jgi:hypothetical protein